MYDFITKPLFRPFFLIGNSVHGSLPLTFDTSNDLERESYHQEKIKNNSRFLFIGENKMVTHSKKSCNSDSDYCSSQVFNLKLWLLFSKFTPNCQYTYNQNQNTINLHTCVDMKYACVKMLVLRNFIIFSIFLCELYNSLTV